MVAEAARRRGLSGDVVSSVRQSVGPDGGARYSVSSTVPPQRMMSTSLRRKKSVE